MKRFSFRIGFGDTDPFGVAYFVAFPDYCKKALDEWLRAKGIAPAKFYRNSEKGWGFPVVETNCRYRSPLKYDDVITVKVNLKEITCKDVTFLFDIKKGRTKVAEAVIRLRCVDRNFKSMPVPEEMQRILS